MSRPPFTIEKPAPNITVIRMEVTDTPNWRQDFMVRSDVHRDSTKCRRDLEDYQISEVQRRNAGLIDVGDMYDVMQGPGDRRACKEALRDELARADYFDAVVADGVAKYRPIAHHICGLTMGNHEEAVVRHYGTNLTKRTANDLRRETGAPVHSNGYQGWYVFIAHRGNSKRQVVMYANHGYGGGGQVTKDMIQAHRMQSYTDADVIATGHTHDLYAVSDVCLKLTTGHREVQRTRWALKCGTLKQTYGNGETTGTGYEQRQGHRPKPLGHNWLTFRYVRDGSDERLIASAQSEALE